MDLASVYGRIEERLEKIDFPALFRDFCRFPFAVYDETGFKDHFKILRFPTDIPFCKTLSCQAGAVSGSDSLISCMTD